MIVVEVTGPAERREVERKRDGRTVVFWEQPGYAHLPGQRYPVGIMISHREREQAYEPGRYVLDAGSLYVDRFQRLRLGRLELRPAKADKAA